MPFSSNRPRRVDSTELAVVRLRQAEVHRCESELLSRLEAALRAAAVGDAPEYESFENFLVGGLTRSSSDPPASFERRKSRHGRWFNAFGITAPARGQDPFHAPAQAFLDPDDGLPTVARVGPQMLELGKARCRRFEQRTGAITIGNVRWMDPRAKHEP